MDELKAWIDTWNYDVVAISETWLQEGCDWQLNIPGFSCFRCDRIGGGGQKGRCCIAWSRKSYGSSMEG